MQYSFKSYESKILPIGFSYPKAYLTLEEKFIPSPNLIWWFVDSSSLSGQRAWEVRNYCKDGAWKYFSDIDPIPFARNGDWAAFFDGNDHSGNPKIVVADLGNKENSYIMENFSSWYEKALKESGLK